MDRLHELIDSEEKASRFLVRHCWQKQRRFCPRCQKHHPYRLSDGRLRCRECGYTFHDFTGRWINRGNLSSIQWLRLIVLFEQELSTREIASRLKLSYNTAYRAVTTLRMAIIAHGPDAHLWVNEQNELLPHVAGDDLVFGIRQQDHLISISPVQELKPEDLFASDLRMVRRGRIIFTDQYAGYNSLVFYLNGVDDNYKYSRIGIVNGLSCFWRFLKERIHKKITSPKFPLFLKEMEFRYNHRDMEMKSSLVGFLCDFEGNQQKDSERGVHENAVRPTSEGVLLFDSSRPEDADYANQSFGTTPGTVAVGGSR